MITLREPLEADWTEVGRLANQAVSHIPGAPKQAEWLRNRLEFEGERQHSVAELGMKIVGYGSIERRSDESEDAARLFLVLAWSQPASNEIADELLSKLRRNAASFGVRRVWMREYSADTPFIEFLLARGFEVVGEYLHGGMQVSNLTCKSFVN